MGESLFRVSSLVRCGLALVAGISFAAVVTAPVMGATSTLPGIDVSHHNSDATPIDWAKVKSDGVRFVFAKATEAATFADGQYVTNKQQVEAAGIAFGAYHFARPDSTRGDAAAEADYFVDNAMLTGRNLLPVLDLEVSGGLGKRKLVRWAKAWLGEVQARLRVKPMIYTTASFWSAHMGDSRWFANNGYRLWVAHWTDADSPKVPATNWGGRGWTLWQYDSCGTTRGISGCVDQDRFNGTRLAPIRIKNNR